MIQIVRGLGLVACVESISSYYLRVYFVVVLEGLALFNYLGRNPGLLLLMPLPDGGCPWVTSPPT